MQGGATVTQRADGLHVSSCRRIDYDFTFITDVFDTSKDHLSTHFQQRRRCLAVVDSNVLDLYGDKIQKYFDHFRIRLKIHRAILNETAKSSESFLDIANSFSEFGIHRKEPVLVIGGGVVTDVAGFACAAYRRSTDYIRIPTTLLGLIDASIAVKVAFNHNKHKNRLGAFHPAIHTFLDFDFLEALPKPEIRNGFAELVKIAACADLHTFKLLDQYCEELIDSRFGRDRAASEEIRRVGECIMKAGVTEKLKLETPDLYETLVDKVMTFGHTWSPVLELIPNPPLRHGHAVSIDMAYSATLARHCGLLNCDDYRTLLNLLSRAGLGLDHDQLNREVLTSATQAILEARDGSLWAPVPGPLGRWAFMNNVPMEKMYAALELHKATAKTYPRGGQGYDMYVDTS